LLIADSRNNGLCDDLNQFSLLLPLRLNRGLGTLSTWDEDAILKRADRLADQAVNVWAAPKLDPAVLDSYKLKVTASAYTISDHPHLAQGPMHDLFEAFRKQVLALDPCVTEEFLKRYVAYKAETNFVDAVPQAKRLRLSLNVGLHEIDDPRGICKDVSGLGRWGNGDVEVGLSSIDELPYVMGLVRQSFEKQMGNGAEA
jgi:predicted transport protein